MIADWQIYREDLNWSEDGSSKVLQDFIDIYLWSSVLSDV